jgi:hypothetical protein
MRAERNGSVAFKGIRVLALIAAIAVALGVLATTAPGQARKVKPAATEVGVSATEIHIAVIADVGSPSLPNLFIRPRDAVLGFANYINASCAAKNRCLAGRRLVVDSYDSRLDPNETRNDEIKACTDDFAMVGTSAVFLNTVDEMRNCNDQAGRTTGIPDIPFVTAKLVHECSDESFPIAAPALRCASKDRHRQTYDANVARGYYFMKKYGNLHGIYVFSNGPTHDSMVASGQGGLRDLGGMGKGIRPDTDFTVSLGTGSQQSGYTNIIKGMKDKQSNYGQCAAAYSCTVLLRREAVLQGITDQVKVWDCTAACYDKAFLQDGGADVEHEYVDTAFLPFYDPREQKANRMLAKFVRYTGMDKVDGFGVYAWSAAVAFRDAVNATVRAHGVNGLTRAHLLAALNNIHKFSADGMLAPIDLAGRKTTNCHVLTQVRNGSFVRVQPTKPGTFDCNPKYLITRKLELFPGP